MAPHFTLQSSAQQLGPSRGGGTHVATQAVNLHMRNATILKKCSAVVFADLKATFNRTVLEYVLGGLSDVASTEKLSRKHALSFLHSWHCSSEHQLRKARNICFPLVYHPFRLGQQLIGTGAQHSMFQVLRTWSSRMLAQNQVILWLTVFSALLFFRYQQELQQALLDEGLLFIWLAQVRFCWSLTR